MKKITVAILSIVLVAMGAMFIFAQQNNQTEGKRGFGKKGFKRGGHGMMFRGLDLTEEQKAQIKQITDNSKNTVKPIRGQMRANKQRLQEVSANGNFDAAQVQAIAAQQGSLSAQLIVERERVKSQVFQVLTPEQRRKAAERREQMKERFKNKMENRRNKAADSGGDIL